MRIKTPPELFVFVLLFFGLAALAAAQFGTGEISGLLVDQQGAAVANAEVIVTNQATAVSKVVATDAQGRYTALDLPVGRYSIEVRRPGFKTHTRS